ncbi:energy-coupling factor ABC transporter ATP-binding protein [Oceanicella actignis]|uniref:energy-coupling factor ABC transporter ATP-binding protein n=1 Tax=Oceanicella actignis TaxID=1189325 RepID=UPI0011E6E93F|nr:ABC transporter ATP-binding protein [Oceanicella actignis]TYO90671.1 biotin transport system ATP-binding protein [Oceanicella actignis]
MDEDAIELTGLRVLRGGRPALDGVTLRLTERRIGVVGRNGSGKSTLARAICGLAEPDAGRVLLGGADPARDRAAALERVGIIFQNPDHQIIFPTVEEEIAFGLEQQGRPRAQARAAARAALAAHGRAHWAERPCAALSEGEKHLVCLIAVLAMAPRTIVLDEPYAGLDIPTSRRLHRVLDALEQRVVLVTHDPAALARYDRVIWLEQGRVRADGPAGPVLAAFAQEMERLGALDADPPAEEAAQAPAPQAAPTPASADAAPWRADASAGSAAAGAGGEGASQTEGAGTGAPGGAEDGEAEARSRARGTPC